MEFGHRLGLVQRQGAVEFAPGEFCLRMCVRQLAIGLLGDRLERAGINHVKQIAGAHDRAIAEFDAGDETADAGADLDFLNRLEPSGEFVPVGNGTLHRLRNRNRRRCGSRLLRRLVAAGGQRRGRAAESTI